MRGGPGGGTRFKQKDPLCRSRIGYGNVCSRFGVRATHMSRHTRARDGVLPARWATDASPHMWADTPAIVSSLSFQVHGVGRGARRARAFQIQSLMTQHPKLPTTVPRAVLRCAIDSCSSRS